MQQNRLQTVTRKYHKDKFNKAIISLQRMHRYKNLAYFAKKELQLHNDGMVDYPFIVFGNEPCMCSAFDPKHKTDNTNFNLIGTGGMNNIFLLCELINWDTVKISKHSPVPKLFIIDYSHDALIFWTFFKKLMLRFNTPAEIRDSYKKMADNEYDFAADNLVKYAPKDYYNPDSNIVYTKILRCLSVLIKANKKFQLVKNVVINSSFIGRDWRDPLIHQTLSEHTKNQRNYVYSSNIIECIMGEGDDYTSEDSQKDVEELTRDICNYQPILSIYARTSITKFRKTDGYPYPDTYICCTTTNPKIHLKELQHKNFSPLTKAEYLQYLDVPACNTRSSKKLKM